MSPSTGCLESDWDVRPTWSYVTAVLGASFAPLAAAILLQRALPGVASVLFGGIAIATTTLAAAIAMKLALHGRWSLVVGGAILAAAILIPAILFRGDATRTRGLVNATGGIGVGLFFLGTIPPSRSRAYAIVIALSMAITVALLFFLV